jgi:hypothetical protein
MNEIKSLGDFPGTNSIRIGYPYPNYTQRYVVVEAEFDPAGPYRNEYGERVTALCDSGAPLGDTPQHGMDNGGELIPCSQKNSDEFLFGKGHAFYKYQFTVTPTISLFNDALRIHALAEGKHDRQGYQNHWGTRGYKNTYYTRTQDNPIFVAQDALREYDPHGGYYDGAFWKLKEVGLRYAAPESLASRIGADNASLILSASDVFFLWRAQEHTMAGTHIYDPENGTLGVDASARGNPFPLSSVTAEVRVSF